MCIEAGRRDPPSTTPFGPRTIAQHRSRHSADHTLPIAASTYTLTAQTLDAKTVKPDGKPLAINSNDDLPSLTPQTTPKGALTIAPVTIAFVIFPNANNQACDTK